MLLTIDIGNTNIVCALFEGSELVEKWRLQTTAPFVCDKQGIEEVIVSSVVSGKNEEIMVACEKQLGLSPIFVNHKNAGIHIDLDMPEEAGADRLCNAVAMVAEYAQDGHTLVGIDFGTATSFDIVSPDNIFIGGILSPGINLSLKAFGMAGAQLPELEIEKTDIVIGKNTIDAMQSGIYWGYVSLIEGTIERIQQHLNSPVRLIGTGGLAPLFKGEVKALDIIDPDLTLKGLLHIDKRIKEKN